MAASKGECPRQSELVDNESFRIREVFLNWQSNGQEGKGSLIKNVERVKASRKIQNICGYF
jgi:hypothetical protein